MKEKLLQQLIRVVFIFTLCIIGRVLFGKRGWADTKKKNYGRRRVVLEMNPFMYPL